MPLFLDRSDAGRTLGASLAACAGPGAVVLGLPRGGVPVAAEVARALEAPLDVFLVRKLGVPGHPELAMGAIASGGVRVLNDELIARLGIPLEAVEAVSAAERIELDRRDRTYRGGHAPLALAGRTVILVDDGLATGATMRAAVEAARTQRPARVIVAVPVGARETCERLRAVADEVVCARMPEPFDAVGLWYERFDQTTDAEVVDALSMVRSRP